MGLSREQLIYEITKLQKKRQDIRSEERTIVDQTKMINMQQVVSDEGNLRDNISKILPKHLVPTNVGDYRQLLSPYWYHAEFNLGTNITITPNYTATASIQIHQDAGFLLTTIQRYTKVQGTAGFAIPLGLTIRDNQSTRQFNDRPIPLNSIGFRARPTKLVTPMLLRPNASVTLTLSSLIDDIAGWSWILAGDSYQEIMLGGLRVNMADEQYLMDNILL